jgi:chromosome segregation ATPase
MVSKEQERKALEQIKKIVDSLGADSYIATAFDGCFEDAQENIENDFAVSNRQRWQSAEHRAIGLEKDVTALQEQLKELSERMDRMRKQISDKELLVSQANEENAGLKAQIADLLDRESELVSLRDDAECRAEVAEAEIIRLKAKLYDLIVGKEG